MARYGRFTFLCNDYERRAIVDLAARLQRSQSDAVRFVVLEATKQLTQPVEGPKENEPMSKGGSNVITA
jgi:hypothetical protein